MRPDRRALFLAGAMLAIAAGGDRGAGGGLDLGSAAAQEPRTARPPDIHVLFVTTAPADSSDFSAGVRRGIRFGADEAAQTAALTGANFSLTTIVLPTKLVPPTTVDSARTLSAGANVVITAVPSTALDSLIGPVRALVLDVTPWTTPLACSDGVLRLSPGAAALRQARVWHPALERFGAQQLNERYRRFSGRTMDGEAWLGWLAAKLAFELPVRARTTDADSLATFARSSRARFDGHKGRALSFDSLTGVIGQPLYQTAGSPPAEVDEPMIQPSCR